MLVSIHDGIRSQQRKYRTSSSSKENAELFILIGSGTLGDDDNFDKFIGKPRSERVVQHFVPDVRDLLNELLLHDILHCYHVQ